MADDNRTRSRRTSLPRLFRLARKELVEILRDRRTILTLVMMPLLLYPLLGITIQKFLLNSLLSNEAVVYRIGVDDPQTFRYFRQLIRRGSVLLGEPLPKGEEDSPSKEGDAEAAAEPDPDADDSAAAPGLPDPNAPPRAEFFVPTDERQSLEDLLLDDTLDLAVLTRRDERNRPYFELVSRNGSRVSQQAEEWLIKRFEAVNKDVSRQVMRQTPAGGLPAEYAERKIGEADDAPARPSLLTFVPLMLVLMTMTGAVYPAIDLTAGERERGTMEILVAAPVSRMALLFGKFVAVLAVAMLTAIFNLTALMITIYTLGLEKFIFGDAGMSWPVILLVLILLLVFAAFFSATLLGLTSFARSFKEAQAYLIPLMLVSLAPAMLSLLPNIEMTPMLAIVPLVNIVMLSRDLLAGDVSVPLLVIAILSTLFYGFLALGIAARIFGTDSILSGGGSSWSDFLRLSAEPASRPKISTAMFFLAVLFPAFIVIGGLASRLDVSLSNKLILNAMVTVTLFVILPIAFSQIFKTRFRSTFLLYPARWAAWVAAILLGVSLWSFVYELEVMTLSKSRLEELVRLFESTMKSGFGELTLPLKLCCLALVPAVCEEFTFRGYLMGAFRKRVPDGLAILITAVLFGLFHVFVRDSLMFERMLPSTLLGILLGFVCLRTGSVLPGMLLHALHNGLLLTMAHYETTLAGWGLDMAGQKHLPLTWLIGAAVPVVVGILLLILFPARERNRRAEDNELPVPSTESV